MFILTLSTSLPLTSLTENPHFEHFDPEIRLLRVKIRIPCQPGLALAGLWRAGGMSEAAGRAVDDKEYSYIHINQIYTIKTISKSTDTIY